MIFRLYPNNLQKRTMKIGIVIAMDKEYCRIKALLTGATDSKVNGRLFTTGKIGANEIVMMASGIGKVNAAMGATEMILNFRPDAVISTGVAGGVQTSIGVQEVVVSTETVYHDLYCGDEVEYGQIAGEPARFASDKRLVDIAKSLDCGVSIHAGLIVTGDWFVNTREKMQEIVSHFPEAMAADMESCAIAHVCHHHQVPFVSFRIISDVPLLDHKAEMYYNFWDTIADNSFNVTKKYLEQL